MPQRPAGMRAKRMLKNGFAPACAGGLRRSPKNGLMIQDKSFFVPHATWRETGFRGAELRVRERGVSGRWLDDGELALEDRRRDD